MLVPIFLGAVVALIFWLDLPRALYKYYRLWKLLSPIPRPSHLSYHWLLGHIPASRKQDEALFLSNVENVNNPANKDLHIHKIWLGPIPLLSVSHSKILAKLLKEPKSNVVYKFLKPWLGEGLLISDGEKWLRNRRLLTPAFHYGILKGYTQVYNRCISVLLEKWSVSALKGEAVELFNTLSLMSLDIILQCAFSFESGCQNTEVKHPYASACCELVHLSTDRIMNPLYMADWLYWFTPHGRRCRQVCNIVHSHANKVISERKSALERVKGDDKSHSGSRKYLDFLDILLVAKDDDGKGMTDLEIRNEVNTFMFEGHDTTTSGMSWTLYCLAKYPEHQVKVRKEVKSVLMGRERLEYDDLKRLKYTTWCIKEAIRLYPPVFFFFRKTTEEMELNNHLIPKDVTIAIETYQIHRNASIWKNPQEYDPLRFQPDNIEKHGPYDYIPFSAGYRNCIGQNFAFNEMKMVIGTILCRFSLEVDKNHKVEMVPRVVLRTKNDIKINLKALS